MSDVFISYASKDRDRIEPIVTALESKGLSVWWDQEIPHGATYDEFIEEVLHAAKCVVVIWSKHSISSDWVRNEANIGAEKKILVPVLIDEVRIPIRFNLIQSARLFNQQGILSTQELERLVKSIKLKIQPNAEAEKEKIQENNINVNVSNPFRRASSSSIGSGIFLSILIIFSPIFGQGVGAAIVSTASGNAITYFHIKSISNPFLYINVIKLSLLSGFTLAVVCFVLQYCTIKLLSWFTNLEFPYVAFDSGGTVEFFFKCILFSMLGGVLSLFFNRKQ